MTELERGIIPIIGKPGSGKSRLGREMAMALLLGHDYNVAHVSIGDRVRKIGSGVMQSAYTDRVVTHLNERPYELMDDDLVTHLLDETLHGDNEESGLVLVDGMPRRASQVGILDGIAQFTSRTIRGVIVTEAPDDVALLRLHRRAPRENRNYVDPETISLRMQVHDEHFPEVLQMYEDEFPDVPLETIDTTGTKEATTKRGLQAMGWMLGRTFDTNKNAS